MDEHNGHSNSISRANRYAWVISIVWTLVILLSLQLNIRQVARFTVESAKIQARVAYEKDVIYRRWNAEHGVVYVPLTDDTPPNPYLADVIEREITNPSGIVLTMINPAYMTRQVHELSKEYYGVFGHITSLQPIRPENAADEWESRALQAFERGGFEVSSVEQIGEDDYLRLMKPLFAEESCLECHAIQGYQVGDIRGGISVAIPMQPLYAIEQQQVTTVWRLHLLMWATCMIGIIFAKYRFDQNEKARLISQQALKTLATTFTATTGKEFFLKVSQHLVNTLGVDYAFIGELVKGQDKVQVVGGYGKGDVLEPFAYDLALTPCENVSGKRPCSYLTDVQALFPEDQLLIDMDIDAYIGIPIFGHSGQALGIMVLLHGGRIRDEQVMLSMVQIFSERVSAEIERSQAENEAHRARRDWQGIFQAIGHPTMLLDPDRNILEANRATEKVVGKPVSELRGLKCYHVFHSTSNPPECCPVDKLNTDTLSVSEIEFEALNGTYLVSCTPMYDEQGELEKIIHSATDISVQVLAEKAVQESEVMLQSVFRVSPIGIGLVNEERHFLWVNDTLCEMVGYSQRDLEGHSARKLYPTDEDYQFVGSEKYKQINAKGTGAVETRWQQKDGSIIDILLSSTPLDPVDRSKGVTFTALDITDQLAAENQLQQRADQLELLRQASLILTSDLALTSVLDAILEQAMQLVTADDTHIYLYHDDILQFGAAKWANNSKQGQFATPRQNGLTYTVARSGDRLTIPNLREHYLFEDWPNEGAILGMPLVFADQVVGVMNVAFNQPYEFTDNELRILDLLADQAAIAIHNARLHEQVQDHARQLENRVEERTAELLTTINLMAGREVRMAELKKVIKKLRHQIKEADMTPVADDPLNEEIAF